MASTHKSVTVDTTVGGSQILPAQASRRDVILTNNGAVDCYIGFGTIGAGVIVSGAAAAAAGGFILKAAGGQLRLDRCPDGVVGITASSSTVVGVLALSGSR